MNNNVDIFDGSHILLLSIKKLHHFERAFHFRLAAEDKRIETPSQSDDRQQQIDTKW